MAKTAKKTDPQLWQRVKEEATESGKGGKPGQWSARKAQMASAQYKKEGGGYEGGKSEDNSLRQWTEEKWDTKSGHKSGETGERYLPKKARDQLSDEDYARSTAKKRTDSAKGRQYSRQPQDVAKGSATARKLASDGASTMSTKAELMQEAKAKGVRGRSRMSKSELERALHG